jgi:photosystem II stability/assembly factor-like uncharacterized protein
MKKGILLFLLLASFGLFAQQAREDDHLPCKGQNLRDLDPQNLPTRHEEGRFLRSFFERERSGTAGQAQAASVNPAPVGAWEPIGPEGIVVQALAANPANSNEIWAITSSVPVQVFRTTNGGLTWSLLSTIDAGRIGLSDLAVDTANPSVVYALGSYYVYKSLDGGLTWNSYYLATGAASGGRIALCSSNPGLVYVSGHYGLASGKSCIAVFKSIDGGLSWSVKPTLRRRTMLIV